MPVWAAGVKMQSETTNIATGTTTKMEILLDQTRMRINMSGPQAGTSVLFLTDGGRDRMVMLNTTKNEYFEMDKQTMDNMAKQMQGAMSQMEASLAKMPPQQRAMMEKMMKDKGMPGIAAAGAKPEKIVYSAKGGSSVNGFSCTKYDGARGGQKVVDLCAAAPSTLKFSPTDFQVFDRMRDFTAAIREGVANSPLASSVDFTGFTDPGYNGIPVQHVTYNAGKPASKTEVKSISSASFSNADFSLGTATKREMPGMPTAGGATKKK